MWVWEQKMLAVDGGDDDEAVENRLRRLFYVSRHPEISWIGTHIITECLRTSSDRPWPLLQAMFGTDASVDGIRRLFAAQPDVPLCSAESLIAPSEFRDCEDPERDVISVCVSPRAPCAPQALAVWAQWLGTHVPSSPFVSAIGMC